LNEPSSFRWTISFMIRSKWTGLPYGREAHDLVFGAVTLNPR
jgi:hypothetical protein